MKLTKMVFLVLLAVILAACSAQGSVAPVSATPALVPSASPAAETTATPVLTPSPITASSAFIIPDEQWGTAQDLITSGDKSNGAAVFVPPGTEIKAAYPGKVWIIDDYEFNSDKFVWMILLIEAPEGKEYYDLLYKENYPFGYLAMDIDLRVTHLQTVEKGQILGIVRSTGLGPYEKIFNLSDPANLIIGPEGKWVYDESLLNISDHKERIKTFVELAKNAQAEETEES